jgi:PIN domain nuclease of toxin-antitoxin system
MTPGKTPFTPFDRAVHALQTSACIQWQVQALRALRCAPVLPRSGCRRGGERSFEKPILLNDDACVSHVHPRILSAENQVFVSVASWWELAIKIGLGKIFVDLGELREAVRLSGFKELPVLGTHTEHVLALPPIHKDPFGRLLVAQAYAEPMRLLTANARLAAYGAGVEVV